MDDRSPRAARYHRVSTVDQNPYAARRELRVEGLDFGPEAIAHLSPAMYAHVNRYGK
jgi:hypothetical protein